MGLAEELGDATVEIERVVRWPSLYQPKRTVRRSPPPGKNRVRTRGFETSSKQKSGISVRMIPSREIGGPRGYFRWLVCFKGSKQGNEPRWMGGLSIESRVARSRGGGIARADLGDSANDPCCRLRLKGKTYVQLDIVTLSARDQRLVASNRGSDLVHRVGQPSRGRADPGRVSTRRSQDVCLITTATA